VPGAEALERHVGMPEIGAKAVSLGIRPGKMERDELIWAIQKAEGYTPCFGRSKGQCPHTNCCFRQDCLEKEGADEVSVLEGALGLSSKVPWPVTIKAKWLVGGTLIVARRLADYMAGTNTVHILYDGIDEVLPYEESDRVIEGVNDFYCAKAIAEGDKVHVQLQGLEPTRLSLYASWKRPLDDLLQLPLQDWDWQRNSLRDCIIITLARLEGPVDYRVIHSKIAVNRDVCISSVVETLSRYCPRVFAQVCLDKWDLAGWASQVAKS